MSGRYLTAAALVLAAACSAPPRTAPAPEPTAEHARPTPADRMPTPVPLPVTPVRLEAPLPPTAALGSIHWSRNSAEHRVLLVQTYRWAGDQLRQLAAGQARGTWAVIMDADETLLDNSTYQLRRAAAAQGYSADSWAAWSAERSAPALPGTVEFTRLVHDLGGRVAVVTNRDDPACPDTRENLRSVRITFDVVLCRVQGQSDKNPRFAAVQSGTGTGLPPLRVLMWVGDNIQDFPRLGQDVRTQPEAAISEFGRSYVLLPNPMYGSWERNPVQ